MQILNIVLYGPVDKIRTIDFVPGRVNIITGDSKTGKSVLIEIVDFCLGAEYNVASGVVNNSVFWYGIRLQLDGGQMFISRPNPSKKVVGHGQPSVFVLQADEVQIPPSDGIRPNITQDALKALLANRVGIGEYTHRPEGYSRHDLTVTFKHSRLYSFQPQTDIDQKDFLFFHQKKDYGVEQSIRDTLPYFLGAIPEDFVKIERDLAEKKRAFNRLQRELKDGSAIAAKSSNRAFELVAEAKAAELLDSNAHPATEEAALAALADVTRRGVTEVFPRSENGTLIELQNQRATLKKEMDEVVESMKTAEQFEREAFGYANEGTHQVARLESVELFDADGGVHSQTCPLCSQGLQTAIPTIEIINTSLVQLRNNLEITKKERPRLKDYIDEQKAKVDDLKQRILAVDQGINAIYGERASLERLRNLNVQKGMILGRIGLYLESDRLTSDFSDLRRNLETLQADIRDLEFLISGEQVEEKLHAILDQLSVQMSEWAKELELEFDNAILQFSIKYLTLFIITPDEKMRLDKVGSGENWVAYHLLIHFALHRYFVLHRRPTPRFLMIDQFSQAYLPPEGIVDSADNKAIRRICDFIFNRTEELRGGLQVIITEHAEPNYPRFKDAIVQRWRDGVKLVPSDW